jgi:hypothetical protein
MRGGTCVAAAAAVTPLGLAVLAELKERPVAEQELARVVRRFGGS